LKPVWI